MKRADVVGITVMRSETSGNILCRLTARHWRRTPCGIARRIPVHTEYLHSGREITLSYRKISSGAHRKAHYRLAHNAQHTMSARSRETGSRLPPLRRRSAPPPNHDSARSGSSKNRTSALKVVTRGLPGWKTKLNAHGRSPPQSTCPGELTDFPPARNSNAREG